jgi:hypothetical protein
MEREALHGIALYVALRNRVRGGPVGEKEIEQSAGVTAEGIDAEFRTGRRYVEGASLSQDQVAALKRALAEFIPLVAETLDDIAKAHGGIFPIVDPLIRVPATPPAKTWLKLSPEGRPEPWTSPSEGDFFATCYAPFARALAEIDASRLRFCPICSEMFYAQKSDMAACSPVHSNALRQRRFREGQRRKVRKRKRR